MDGEETVVKQRASLTDFAPKKTADAPALATVQGQMPEKAAASPKDQKGQTLRLSTEAWRQLKMLALDEAKPAHDLLIEAVNDLFRKHGKPPIA